MRRRSTVGGALEMFSLPCASKEGAYDSRWGGGCPRRFNQCIYPTRVLDRDRQQPVDTTNCWHAPCTTSVYVLVAAPTVLKARQLYVDASDRLTP